MVMFGPGEEMSTTSLVTAADDADLLAADLEHQRRLEFSGHLRLRVGLHVGAGDRKVDEVHECGEHVLAVVEFVVAERHGVGLHLVEELGLGLALVGRVEQRSLEIVAGAEQYDVLALERLARIADGGDQARRAADALALGLFLGRTGRFILVVGFDAAVPVVDMQNVQCVVGEGCRGRHGKCGRREGGHGCELLHRLISRLTCSWRLAVLG